jgi:hypothetical protein
MTISQQGTVDSVEALVEVMEVPVEVAQDASIANRKVTWQRTALTSPSADNSELEEVQAVLEMHLLDAMSLKPLQAFTNKTHSSGVTRNLLSCQILPQLDGVITLETSK